MKTKVILALAAITLAPVAMASVIYQDSFNRNGALHGSTPDVTTGGATWSGGGTTSTEGGGQLTPGGGGELPFTPVAGYIYTLSYTYDPNASGTDANISIGFMGSTDGGTTGQAFFYQEVRTPNQMDLQVVNSGNNSINIADPAPDAPTLYNILLNTTNPTWTAKFFVGGESRAFVNLVNPNISRVRFSMWTGGNWTNTVSNFSLTENVSAVPEVSSHLALLALGSAGLLTRRRKSRKA